MERGKHYGIYVPAIDKARRAGVEITAHWLIANCDLTRRQADNALQYAARIGLLKLKERGRYEAATAA